VLQRAFTVSAAGPTVTRANEAVFEVVGFAYVIATRVVHAQRQKTDLVIGATTVGGACRTGLKFCERLTGAVSAASTAILFTRIAIFAVIALAVPAAVHTSEKAASVAFLAGTIVGAIHTPLQMDFGALTISAALAAITGAEGTAFASIAHTVAAIRFADT
jgi:hypothetical protein